MAPPASPARRSARRPRSAPTRVRNIVIETPDTVTLTLEPDEPIAYRAGQFITIDPHQFTELAPWVGYLEQLKGRREPPRAYSLASAPHEPHLAITVKEERYVTGETDFPPLLSPLLVRQLRPGRTVMVGGFAGGYVLDDDVGSRTDHVVHVCAGSGIVPNWSMIKHALAAELPVRHTLVYGNRTWQDVIYRDALAALQRRYPQRLRVIHALSREPSMPPRGAVSGRVSEQVLAAAIEDPNAVEVYACGPAITRHQKARAKQQGEIPAPRFMETVKSALAAIGVPRERIHTESYG